MAEEQALGAAYKKCYLDQQPPLNSTTATPNAAAKLILTDESVSAALHPPSSSVSAIPPATTTANRCVACRKRVGLTGFRCRCGSSYCGVHRYPEKHGCGFDYKKAGREQIQRQNPVVVAEKLRKI